MQRREAIQLNYNYKMEFLQSKTSSFPDWLSHLIPKLREPLEDTVIAAIKTENEIKNALHNTVREFPITLEEIRFKLRNDEFIIKMADQITDKVKNFKK